MTFSTVVNRGKRLPGRTGRSVVSLLADDLDSLDISLEVFLYLVTVDPPAEHRLEGVGARLSGPFNVGASVVRAQRGLQVEGLSHVVRV